MNAPSIMTKAINFINKPEVINRLDSPNAARYSVVTLIGINGVTRVAANLLDKTETPETRKYSAVVEGMHQSIALITTLAVAPLFAIGGLFAGRNFLAKEDFQNFTPLNTKEQKFLDTIRSDKKQGLMSRLLSPIKGIKERMTSGGILKLNSQLNDIFEHNREILAQARKNGNENPVIKKVANNIVNSRKFGDAVGMAVAIAVISPIFTNKFAPSMMNLFTKEKEQKNNLEENNPFQTFRDNLTMVDFY